MSAECEYNSLQIQTDVSDLSSVAAPPFFSSASSDASTAASYRQLGLCPMLACLDPLSEVLVLR